MLPPEGRAHAGFPAVSRGQLCLWDHSPCSMSRVENATGWEVQCTQLLASL